MHSVLIKEMSSSHDQWYPYTCVEGFHCSTPSLCNCLFYSDTLLNLDSLLIQLQAEVTPKWYQFGEIAGVDKGTLNKYTEYPDNQCIIEVLDCWLRNHTGKPTWREVAEILRGIDLQKLASNIERVYETGTVFQDIHNPASTKF